jgi:glucose/arabinose dehydrogenase
MRKKFIAVLVVAAVLLFALGIFAWKNLRGIGPVVRKPPQDIAGLIRHQGRMPLKLPPGFLISIFAHGLGKPRVLVEDPEGTLLASIPSQGRVVALPDRNRDGLADEVVTVIDGLSRPHGLAFRCAQECRLYIAEEDQVNAFSYDGKTMKAVRHRKIIDLPTGGFHVTRTLLFPPGAPDTLLISVGSSCNACREEDWRRAAILAVPAEGGKASLFAAGLRNAVFMTIHPRTKDVWTTEMGRDMLGDDLPPDEINIVEGGRNYGWPFCYGKNIHDDEFDGSRSHQCREPEIMPSFIDIPAHSAPLGLAFFPDEGWPDKFRNDLLVAYHGSWNRSIPTGYKIVRYRLDRNGMYLGKEDFVTGWLTPQRTALGRPVDILIKDDGTLFVSDDKAGVIYRITGK